MTLKYFYGLKTMEELKAAYKTLCKKFHPDINPTGEKTMMQINAEYDYIVDRGLCTSNVDEKGRADRSHEPAAMKAYREIISRLIVLDGLDIELCGAWLWISGATRLHKDTLKQLGCMWAKKKLMWYWRPAEIAEYRSRGKATMDEIRDKYGSVAIQGNPQRKIATA